ncbi:uncharacterized protein LOC130692181 [Daphnia carinata]|uniref:uncharacterized protein LOC130692181 n=1 Tax=Daphnia carinata TaxID=120202 RepID=UPI00257F7E81|nr:uncharacterized protein LOC130692181 [Daphnia carinata]
MDVRIVFIVLVFFSIQVCTISAKWRERWNVKSSFPASMATQLIQRISSTQKPSKRISSSQQHNPSQINFLSGSRSQPSLDIGMPGVSINRLVDTSRYQSSTRNRLSDTHGNENTEPEAIPPVKPVHSRHSSHVLRAKPHPWFPTLTANALEDDSYVRALELSRLPCQKLEDPTDCYDFSRLFPSNQQLGLEYDAHSAGEGLKNSPTSSALDFSLFHLLQIKEDVRLQSPYLFFSPNNIEFTVQYIRPSASIS